jgi:hypothetical protein
MMVQPLSPESKLAIPMPMIIKLNQETSLKSQASEWLKWQVVSNLSFMIMGPNDSEHNLIQVKLQ